MCASIVSWDIYLMKWQITLKEKCDNTKEHMEINRYVLTCQVTHKMVRSLCVHAQLFVGFKRLGMSKHILTLCYC